MKNICGFGMRNLLICLSIFFVLSNCLQNNEDNNNDNNQTASKKIRKTSTLR